jgi:glycosyltransferase involved in cell wall biosynthesis
VRHKKKIIFVKFGKFSHTNDAVFNLLNKSFPQYDIIVFDVVEAIKDLNFTFLQLNIHGILEYGFDIFLARKDLKVYRWRTAFFCKTIKKLMQNNFPNQNEIAFTFQTQSLFDASISGTPHFLYTDHTLLANLEYPDMDIKELGFSTKWRALEKTFYLNSSCVFTMSNNVSRSLTEYYSVPIDKVKCVGVGANAYEGMSEADFPERDIETYNVQTILFVGVLWELKGGPELVSAFKIVRKQFPDAKLLIVGTSPDVVETNIEIIGRIPLDQVGSYFQKSSIFCMPSKGDAFGIVFLEAYFNRLPVIALQIGAAPDVIQHGSTGFMVPPGDIQELANTLIDLIGSPHRCKQFGDKGFSENYPRYTWKNVGTLIKTRIEMEIM